MNILLTIFLAPIALFAGLIALRLFIQFFWIWVGLGCMAVLAFVGYFWYACADSYARTAAYYASPEYKRQQVFDQQGALRNP